MLSGNGLHDLAARTSVRAEPGGDWLPTSQVVISTKVLQREENCEHIHEIVVGV